MDWDTVPVEDEGVMDERQKERDIEGSVLSPTYRKRGILGGQEVGGLGGAIAGGVAGIPLGPFGVVAGSALGAFGGGAAGEFAEQQLRDEPTSTARMAEAGVEEALWDLGGNLVFKVGGQLIKATAKQLGFGKDSIPDATQAAQEFLQRQGSSLPKASLYDSGALSNLQGGVTTPLTGDLFKQKEDEIRAALVSGRKDVLKGFTSSPEFAAALQQNKSPQQASGQILQSFIKDGETALSKAVDVEYKDIFKDKKSSVSMFGVRSWADKLMQNPSALTAAERTILKEIQGLPPQVNFEVLHNIRSRWLAENRDKYSAMGSEKDARAVGTISGLIKQLDDAADMSARQTLDEQTLAKYRTVTKNYREGIQGLHTDAIVEALSKNPEEVGGYLFASGKETPVQDLYKAIATSQKLSKKSSKEVLDSLRYGYLEALTTTPENMLKFANDLEKNAKLRNTFNVLFDPEQQKAIRTMNTAAQKGLVRPQAFLSSTSRGLQAVSSTLGQAGLYGAGYLFLLSPEQQERVKENLGEAAVASGALFLSQRKLAKMLLDPKGAKAVTMLSQAKDKLSSPSAFTKLVVEPIANIYKEPEFDENIINFQQEGQQPVDWANVPTQ